MRKAADAFRSIGEVSRLVGVPPHVLRYWETQFPQLAPVKRADGRRYYRPEDLHLAAGLCELLREEGMTTRGAARMIARDKGAALRARGLARLPERFRGEAVEAAEDGAVEAVEAAPGTLDPESSESAEELAALAAASPLLDAEPQGAEALADTDCQAGVPAESEPPAAVAAETEGTTMRTPEAEASAGPQDAAAGAPATGGSPGEAPVPEGAAEATPAPEPSLTEAPLTEAPLTQAPAAEAAPPAAPDPQAPAAEAAVVNQGDASSAPHRPAEEASTEAVPAHHPVPSAADLPLFPGLAPAAPPPGIWLPRLAATASALRAMTPPQRPPAQMQWLRDRLAALIDPGA